MVFLRKKNLNQLSLKNNKTIKKSKYKINDKKNNPLLKVPDFLIPVSKNFNDFIKELKK
jgi:hypothetical protein